MLRGGGVPQDSAEAARWDRLAAEQGNVFAQHKLGLMCATSEGVPENDKGGGASPSPEPNVRTLGMLALDT